jgi:hypothetical protein
VKVITRRENYTGHLRLKEPLTYSSKASFLLALGVEAANLALIALAKFSSSDIIRQL